jgi:DNA polymerase-3 subunit delta'
VGKRQFALELAKALVCLAPCDLESCSQCTACRRVDSVTLPSASAEGKEYDRVFFTEHPDVGMVVPFNRTLRVGSIRQLEVEANFRPFEARSRIFIVDDSEKMNDSSANALLKTLEEPPPTSHIFLISSRPDSMLATIRSRCQILRFAPVEREEIERLLLRSHQYSQEDARMVAAYAKGSVANAIGSDIDEIRERREMMVSILQNAIGRHDRVSLFRAAEKVADAKIKSGFEDALNILQSIIRDIWAACKSDAPLDNADLSGEIRLLAKKAEPARLAAWLEEIEEIRETLAVNINKKIAADALMAQMAAN